MKKFLKWLKALFKCKKHNINTNQHETLHYTTEEGKIINVILKDKNVWLSQKRMGELFGVERNTITYHLKTVYKTGELSAKTTSRKFRLVRQEGGDEVNRNIQFYNLDAVISAGYHVDSKKATEFRTWANSILKEICN